MARMILEELVRLVGEYRGPWVLALIFFAAAFEYWLPPVPGDAVVLLSSLWVSQGHWSFWVVFTFAVAGGLCGTASHYLLGRALRREDGTLRGGLLLERVIGRGSLPRFFAAFERYGYWVILVNRAIPGIRSVTFVAAGAAHLPAGRTLVLGLVSNALWSMVLLVIGTTVGQNLEKILSVFDVYQRWLLYGVGALILAFWLSRRWKKKPPAA